jgi:hypothetical protein
MTNHFNKLTEAELERLAILAEEASEVQKIVSKIIRHGYASFDPTASDMTSNRSYLQIELGDFLAILDMMVNEKDVDKCMIDDHKAGKERRSPDYLHHQKVKNEEVQDIGEEQVGAKKDEQVK